jgi:hypothetical protein
MASMRHGWTMVMVGFGGVIFTNTNVYPKNIIHSNMYGFVICMVGLGVVEEKKINLSLMGSQWSRLLK